MKTRLLIIIIGIVAIMAVSTITASHYILSSDFIKAETMPDYKSSALPEDQMHSDADKIPDYLDECPNVPENLDGYHDSDGCPDDLDSFERCVQGGGRVWPNGNGCTDEHATHLAPYEIRKEKCEERGGALDSGYDPNTWDCQIPVSDEGKQCTDSSQCKEVCETKTKDGTAGMCTGYHNLGYNSWELKDGKTIHHIN